MSKVWAWVKKHWKWIVFPVGILGAVLGWFLWWRSRDPVVPVSGTTDDVADKTAEDLAKAAEEFAKAREEVNKRAEERLKDASEEQLKEWEEIKHKPPDEVAKWIDNLS